MALRNILFIGLDVQKETIAITHVGEEREAETVALETISDQKAVRAGRKLSPARTT